MTGVQTCALPISSCSSQSWIRCRCSSPVLCNFSVFLVSAGVADLTWETRLRPGGPGHPVDLDDAAAEGRMRAMASAAAAREGLSSLESLSPERADNLSKSKTREGEQMIEQLFLID